MLLKETLQDPFVEALQTLWVGVVAVVPKIIIAIIIFLLGWVIAVVLERAVAQLVRALKLDSLLMHTGLDDLVRRAGFKLDSGLFIGGLVKWFFIIIFLKLSLGIVELVQVDAFLDRVINFLPAVIVAVLVLFAGSIIADAMAKLVTGSAKAANIAGSQAIGKVTRWIIWIFTIFIALTELRVALSVVLPVIYGIVGMLAIAGGIAFGIGGKETAKRVVERIEQGLSGK